jgi:transcriptional regulator with XRE-family HTH domain
MVFKGWLKKGIDKYIDKEEYILEGKVLEITEQISKRLEELKWSNKDFAHKMKTSQAWITKLLNGKNNFTLKTLLKISKTLNMQLDINLYKEKSQPTYEAYAFRKDNIFETVNCYDYEWIDLPIGMEWKNNIKFVKNLPIDIIKKRSCDLVN